MKKIKSWFTLIELVVSITILSMIMISIFAIFKISNDINNKTEISRSMQENIKNIVETFWEEVRTKKIIWLNNSLYSWCEIVEDYKNIWSKICFMDNTNSIFSYYIAYFDNITKTYSRVIDMQDCWIWKKSCMLVKSDWTNIESLSNSWVDFRDFKITLLNNWKENRKILLNFTIKKKKKKWINSDLIKNNKIIFQTTLSQRLYNSY